MNHYARGFTVAAALSLASVVSGCKDQMLEAGLPLSLEVKPNIQTIPMNEGLLSADQKHGFAVNRDHSETLSIQFVQINVEKLKKDNEFLLQIDGRSFVVTVTERKHIKGEMAALWGHVGGTSPGSITMGFSGKEVSASIWVAGESFRIDPLGDGLHVLRKIDPALYPDPVPTPTPDPAHQNGFLKQPLVRYALRSTPRL